MKLIIYGNKHNEEGEAYTALSLMFTNEAFVVYEKNEMIVFDCEPHPHVVERIKVDEYDDITIYNY